MHERYQRYKKSHFKLGWCSLCDKERSATLKTYRYWKIVNNLFPWDRIAKIQHMLLPKRHVPYQKLNKKEKQELEKLKGGYVEHHYDIMAEATHRKKSIPEHYHLHLIVLK